MGTNIFEGLDQSVSLLAGSSLPGRQFIVLLTDGQQVTRGAPVPSPVVAGQRAADNGITVFTIGYSIQGTELEQIAALTGGQAFSADNDEELQEVFDTIATTLRVSITK